MESANGVSGDKGGPPPPPSPLTGCYLLIVVGEPYNGQHKDIILQRIAKGLLSWDLNECLVDLEKELAIITEQALEGEEARYGERLIQFASENLVTEILIHPAVSTLVQCMRNLLSSFTRHRHIIHAGYTFAANGSWALQDGTFSYVDFSEAFQELEVQRVVRAYENGITMDIHCGPEGDWPRLPKEAFAKACKVRINPTDILTSGSPSISGFVAYLSPFLVPTALENLLESSDVVGNIRFSRPTLYVFPGGQGDAALFGINGFNMLLDGGYSRKACFWDFVRHLDRLDAVLMTRLNNSNVGGISSVLRRKKQDALYPQIGHFFFNVQERKAVLSPDGDKDKDPLLINLLEEGQEIISNLRHLNLNPQVCYRDSEPINLYHKVGHGTLDMYVLSPAKDSKEVREFLMKWNHSDQKLFANAKSSRDFSFPIQNLISISALLVWRPSNPSDTITRILYPGSCPQNKILEGLDRLKNLDFIKHPSCTEKSLTPISTTKKTAKEAIFDKIITKDRTPVEKKENKLIENDLPPLNGEVKDKIVKKSDSTESDRSTKAKKPEEPKIIENGDKSKPKPKAQKPRGDSQQRRKPIEKKSPTLSKKPVENGDVKKPIKQSPISTPAKSAKDANNRKVIENKAKKEISKTQAPSESKPKAEKVDRVPISRRPPAKKAPISPAKKVVNGIQKPDSISRKGKLDKEGTTDSSTVSTPSADQDSVLKKDISKLTPDELQQMKAQELAELKEEQEAIKEIEAVFRKGESHKTGDEALRKVKDISLDDKLEKEEYLIIEKEEIEQLSTEDKENKDENQKLARDSEESEKQRKASTEEQEAEKEKIQEQLNGVPAEIEETPKPQEEPIGTSKVTSPDEKVDVSTDKKITDKEGDEEIKDIVESQPDEKVSANIKSGDTTTAPTLPEDERIPLDEIKEDIGPIEEKYVKEDTKEKEVPAIHIPPKTFENISKLPAVVGIRLDKQQHIRDIVKTPDEVADLPVHEEVDYEYTHELKVETPKSNEIIEKKDHQEKDAGLSKEELKEEGEKDIDVVAVRKSSLMQEELKNLTETVLKNESILEKDILKDYEKDAKEEATLLEQEKVESKETTKPEETVESKDEEKPLERRKRSLEVVEAVVAKEVDAKTEKNNEIKEESKVTIKEETKEIAEEKTNEEVSKEIPEIETKEESPRKEVTAEITKETVQEEVAVSNEKDEIKIKEDVVKEKPTDKAKEEIEEIKDEIKIQADITTKEIAKEDILVSKEQHEEKNDEIKIKKDSLKEEIIKEDIPVFKEKDETSPKDEDKSDKIKIMEQSPEEEIPKKDSSISASPKDEEEADKIKIEKESPKENIQVLEEKDDTSPKDDEIKNKEKSPTEEISKEDILVSNEKDEASPKSETKEKEATPIKELTEKDHSILIDKDEIKVMDDSPKAKEEIEIMPATDVQKEMTKLVVEKIERRKSLEQMEKIEDKLQGLRDALCETETNADEPIQIVEVKDEKIHEDIEKVADILSDVDKLELGRKSPKEREEDVMKIVAGVAEVLKSEAPLEKFEAKIPITTSFSTFTTPYVSELRETHITTVDSPTIEMKVINTDIPPIPEEPHTITASFLEEEQEIAPVHDTDLTKSEEKRNLLKESQELMMATSKMLSDIKSANGKSQDNNEETEEKKFDEENLEGDEDKLEEDVRTVHRMLVTASSEDGGEETEICPPGTITFSRSSESSGRSSPDPSQKASSQKSSIVDTISDTLSTVRQVAEIHSEKDSGIDDAEQEKEEGKIETFEDIISGKSSPEKDASIKSLASGKSTPDISDLEKSKEISSVEEVKKDTIKKDKVEEISDDSGILGKIGKGIEETLSFVEELIHPPKDDDTVSQITEKVERKQSISKEESSVSPKVGKIFEETSYSISAVTTEIKDASEDLSKDLSKVKDISETKVDDFATSNQEYLSNVQNDFIKVADQLKDTESEESYEIYVDDVKTKKDSLIKVIEEAGGKITDVKEQIEETSEQIKGDIKVSKDEIAIKEETLETVVQDAFSDLKEDIADNKDVVDDIIKDTKDELIKEKEEVVKDVKTAKDLVLEDIKDAKAADEEIKKDLTEKKDVTKVDLKKEKESLLDEIKDKEEKLQTTIHEALKDSVDTISDVKASLIEDIKDVKDDILQEKEDLKIAKEKLTDFKDDITDKTQKLEDKVSEKKDEIVEGIKDHKDAIVCKAEDIGTAIQEEVKEKSDDLKQTKDEVLEKLKDTKEAIADKKIDELKKSVEEAIVDKKESIKSVVADTADDLLKKKDELTDDVKVLIDDKKQETQSVIQEISESVTSTKDSLLQSAKHVSDEKEKIEAEIKEKAEETKKIIYEEIKEKKHSISEKIDDLSKAKDEIVDGLKDIKDEIVDKKEKIESHIHSGIAEKTEEAKDILQEVTDQVEDKKETLKSAVGDAIADLTQNNDDVFKDIKEKKHKIESDIHDIVKEASSTVTETKDDILKGLKDAKEDILDKKEKLEDVRDSAKEKADLVKDTITETKDDFLKGIKDIKGDILDQKEKLEGDIYDKKEEVTYDIITDAKDSIIKTKDDVLKGIIDTKDDILHKTEKLEDDIHDKKQEIATDLHGRTTKDEEVKDTKDILDKQEKIEEDVKEKHKELKDIVEDRHDKNQQITAELTETKDDISKDIKDHILYKTEKLEVNLHDSVKDLKESVDDRTEKIEVTEAKDSLQKSIKEVKDSVSDQKDKLEAVVDEKFGETKTNLLESTMSIKDELSDIKEKLDTFTTQKIDDLTAKKEGKLDKVKESVQDMTKETIEKVAETTSSLLEDSKDAKKDFIDKKDQILEDVEDKKDILDSISKTKEEAQSIAKDVIDPKDHLIDEQKQLESTIKDHITEKLDDLSIGKGKLPKEVKETEKQIEKDVQEALHEISDKKDSLVDSIKEIKDVLVQDLTQKKEQIHDTVVDTIKETKNTIAEEKEKLETKLKEPVDDVNKAKDRISENIKDLKTDVVEEKQNLEKMLHDTTQEKLDDAKVLKDELLDTASNAYNDILHKKEEVEETFTKTEDKIKTEAGKAEKGVKESLTSVKDEADGIISKIEKGFSDFFSKSVSSESNSKSEKDEVKTKDEKSPSEVETMDEKMDKNEHILEESANDLEDTFENVLSMSQSVIFDKCESPSDEDPPKENKALEENAKAESVLEKSTKDLEETFETVEDMSKSVIFEKCESPSDEHSPKENKDLEENAKAESVLEKSTKDLEETFETVEEMSKSVIFEKCESPSDEDPPKENKALEKSVKAEAVLEKSSKDLEETFETVEDMSKSVIFEKCDLPEKRQSVTDLGASSTEKESFYEKVDVFEKGEKETMEKGRKEVISDIKISPPEKEKKTVQICDKDSQKIAPESIRDTTLKKESEQKEIQDNLLHEKEFPGRITPPTVPVSPNITDEVKFTTTTDDLIKEVSAKGLDPESDDEEEQYSITSQVAHSRDSSHGDFELLRNQDPMSMSFYGALPDEEDDLDDKVLAAPTEKTDSKKKDEASPAVQASSSSQQDKKDPIETWGKPLELPAPTCLYEITKAKFSTPSFRDDVEESNETLTATRSVREMDMMSASFYGDLPTHDTDPIHSWGKPLGLPSPAAPNDNKGTPKKEKKLPASVTAKNKLNDDKKRAESPSKYNKNKKVNPVYVDLTYVPHHGNTYYAYVDFFRKVRARYYVFSGIEPSREVYNALLEAKQTWEDKDLEVTIIPTYDTDILGYWVAENEELLTKYKIDLSPSASRCTINLQDHETSCSAYRLEF